MGLPALHVAFQHRNGGSPEPDDGVAELWMASLDLMASEDPAVQQAALDLLEDERNFIDQPSSPMWIAIERPVVGEVCRT